MLVWLEFIVGLWLGSTKQAEAEVHKSWKPGRNPDG